MHTQVSWNVFDHVPFGVTIWKDQTGKPEDMLLVYANSAANKASGYNIQASVGGLIGTHWPEVLSIPDDINSVVKSLATLKDGNPRTITGMPYGDKGRGHAVRTFDIYISKADHEHVLLFYKSSSDSDGINKDVAVERKLLMMQNLPGYSIFTEPDGTILDVDKLHPDYPLTIDEFRGLNIVETSGAPDQQRRTAEILEDMQGKDRGEYVTSGQPPGHWYFTVVQRVKLPGNGPVFLWTSWDITSLKVAEQKLRAANEDLEQFAYIVSHDLQEPIRTIVSYIDILQEEYAHLFDDGEPEEFFGYIKDSAIRQQRLIQDILVYSRTASMKFEACAIAMCYDVAKRNLRALINRTGAQVVWVGPRAFSTIASTTYVIMALQNLISNACKYVAPGTTPDVKVWATQDGPHTVLHVQDNGIGIDPEYKDLVFRMFKRVHTGEYEGTGIGLPVCKRIARQHGGDCWFDSDPGKGSTFHLSIRAPMVLIDALP